MDFDFKILLSSLITASSFTFAVSVPFIIFFVTDYKNKKDKLLQEIKLFTPKLNAYIEFIYYIYNSDFWVKKENIKKYISAVNSNNKELINKLQDEDSSLSLFYSFYFFYKEYNYDNRYKVYTYKELDNHRIRANWIWYYQSTSYHEFENLFNISALENFDTYSFKQIKRTLSIIDYREYQNIEKLNPDIIATISGDIEIDVIEPLLDLTWKFERPLNPVTTKIFRTSIITLLFGVILPLIIMNFNSFWIPIFTFIISTTTTIFTLFSFILIIIFLVEYIQRINN